MGEILKECLTKDRERVHYEKGISIQELLDEEFPIFKKETAKANKYGEITIVQAKIHIPKGYNFGQIHVVKYWDRFKVLSPFGEVLFTDYRIKGGRFLAAHFEVLAS